MTDYTKANPRKPQGSQGKGPGRPQGKRKKRPKKQAPSPKVIGLFIGVLVLMVLVFFISQMPKSSVKKPVGNTVDKVAHQANSASESRTVFSDFSQSESSSSSFVPEISVESTIGAYNKLKITKSDETYADKADENYQAAVKRGEENIDKMFKATMDYLGSERNWNAILVQEGQPRPPRVTSDDGILDYFIQQGSLVHEFVSSVNRTRYQRDGVMGQGGQTQTVVRNPVLGDKYHITYIKTTDVTPDFNKPTSRIVLHTAIEYTVDGQLDDQGKSVINKMAFDFTLTNEGLIQGIKYLPSGH